MTAPPESSPQPWPDVLLDAIAFEGVRREQARPLTMVTACTGMGSQSRAWRATGLSFREHAAAEPKQHAMAFLAADELLAEHHFNDIRSLVDGGRSLPINNIRGFLMHLIYFLLLMLQVLCTRACARCRISTMTACLSIV